MAALVSPFLCSPGFNVKFPSFSSANRRLSFSNESVHVRSPSTGRYSMFIGAKPVMKDGNLSFNGKDIVTDVPRNIVVTPFTDSSAFLGATSDHSSSRHIFKLGIIQGVRLLCLFRFKIFWMIPRVGNAGSDIPVETQMLLLEATEELSDGAFDGSISYVVLLPLLDGEFRSSLQGNSANEIEICVESGDPSIVTSQPLKAVFVNCGENPFELMKESMKILEKYTGTFTHRESKQMPGIMDWLGWCTWDAFYHDVNPQGIKEGLKRLYEGGTPAKFLIIDDGWQDTSNDFQKEGEPFVDGTQFGGRLLSIKENSKFQKTEKDCSSLTPGGLKDFVSDIKSTFGLKYVYVWHALLGYWGGLNPEAPGTKKYSPKMSYPEQSPGNLANMRDLSMDSMEKYGIGVLDPARVSEFYDDLHGYLVSQGVDGVKVDAQNILETISNGLGGRVSLTRHFQQSLEKSIASNFPENSIICCMGLSTDSIYHLKKSAITRASDDYYPRNPKTQGTHVAAVAFNSIFLGEVVVPDWDMFYSRHSAAEFHAVARAVGGCAVYVSDKPGQHDFKVLKRLVLPDGSVLRAKFPGRPSRDCLFIDPVMDGKSLLKIWNLNKFSGVIGVFNCQGTGSWPCTDDTVEKHASSVIAGQVSPADIEYFEEVSGELWTEECAIFSFQTGLLSRMSKEDSFTVELDVLQCNVFTVSPIKLYIEKIEFAPVGLIDMYNSGGAIEAVEFCNENGDNEMHIKGRGSGRFGAYSSATPKLVRVNSNREEFTFNADDHFLIMAIPSEQNYWEIVISY